MMYTARYGGDGDERLPEGYNGTMLREDECREDEEPTSNVAEPASSSLLYKLMPRGLEGIFDIPILKRLNIGIEEILIGATALFLLVSHGGDKECAIMLLLLLFVK